ncbi:hypothetical protein Aab01nite_18700 [Paractinoplanes abujensis]|nr:hypothetical protein Aab01nite_18700 [Actinoplanes abujensis]
MDCPVEPTGSARRIRWSLRAGRAITHSYVSPATVKIIRPQWPTLLGGPPPAAIVAKIADLRWPLCGQPAAVDNANDQRWIVYGAATRCGRGPGRPGLRVAGRSEAVQRRADGSRGEGVAVGQVEPRARG